jgi:hypothetical protein
MQDDEYDNAIDELEEEYEQNQDISDAQLDSYEGATFPQPKQESNLYNWFWKVVRLNKPFKQAKVGNLNNTEIGQHGVTMRDAMNLAHLGHLFHHHKFGNYFATRAKIISATSMAKGGWFMDLSISQKKVRERAKKSSPLTPAKWRLFNKKGNQNQEE